jgi:hypothetical protein
MSIIAGPTEWSRTFAVCGLKMQAQDAGRQPIPLSAPPSLRSTPINQPSLSASQRCGSLHELVTAACYQMHEASPAETLHSLRARVQVPLIEPVMEIVREGVARGLPMAVASGGTRHHVSTRLGQVRSWVGDWPAWWRVGLGQALGTMNARSWPTVSAMPVVTMRSQVCSNTLT